MDLISHDNVEGFEKGRGKEKLMGDVAGISSLKMFLNR
jgi:hypothetical protein